MSQKNEQGSGQAGEVLGGAEEGCLTWKRPLPEKAVLT